MSHNVSILRRAQKEMAQLPGGPYEQVRDAISALSREPRPAGCDKLTARPGWRIRVGNYRVVYEIDDKNKNIVVLHIGHRRDIYR